jgi:diguanylate cyclase (GGDEF)-like protein
MASIFLNFTGPFTDTDSMSLNFGPQPKPLQDDRRLGTRRRARNIVPMRIVCWLTISFFSGFWFLDFFVLPDHVFATFWMRSGVGAFAVFIVWASYYRKRFFRTHLTFFTFALPLYMVWTIAAMCWLHQGYESSYYAGMNLVILVIGMVFSWSVREEIIFYSLVYGFYMLPLLFGFLGISDTATFVSNQFFLTSTIILTAISQRHRVMMEAREFQSHCSRQKYLSQLRRLATTDTLTGICNRAHTLSQGEREFTRCERYHRNFSVIMVDIDWFKRINDTYTHRVGDEVIQETARRLALSVRSIDIVGRFGGEEFLVLLPETEQRQASRMVAGRIQVLMRREPVQTSQGPIPISVSIGVAGAIAGEKLSTVIHRADEALYAAKHQGRDRVVEATIDTPQKKSA